MSSALDPSPAELVSSVLTATRALRTSRVVSVLDEAAVRFGLDAAIDDVVFPSLRVVGTFWASGTVDVAHEHLLSTAVTRWVYSHTAQQVIHRRGSILLAAGPQDLHTLGLDCLELLLALRGVEACNLGGQIPPGSLVVAAREIRPTAVVVCSHNPAVTTEAVRAVRAIAAAGLPTYYAGSSFASQFVRQHTPGTALDSTLSSSADLLARLHTVAGAEPVARAAEGATELSA